jgi:hypothetical protein
METLGSLSDKLTIARIRLAHVKTGLADEVGITNQISDLRTEIDSYINKAVSGEIPRMREKKHKQYFSTDDNISPKESIGENIEGLSRANIVLWHLEDERRSVKTTDERKVEVADLVSRYNQQRNQYIDEIDRLFSKKIKSR